MGDEKLVICTCAEVVADGVEAPEGWDDELAGMYYAAATAQLIKDGIYSWDTESGSHHWRGGRYGNPQQRIGYIYVRGEITPKLRAVLERADDAGTAAMEAEGRRLLAVEAESESEDDN